jgi:transporter family-2 protein
MSRLLFTAIAFALVAGFALAAQGGINGTLGKRMTHPLHASFVSFAVGFVALLLMCLVWARSLPRASLVFSGPWWSLTGGLLGCIVVTTSLLMAPRVGATVWLSLLVCAQFAAAVLLDHFGWVGYPVHAASVGRIAGVALILAGVVLVCRSC